MDFSSITPDRSDGTGPWFSFLLGKEENLAQIIEDEMNTSSASLLPAPKSLINAPVQLSIDDTPVNARAGNSILHTSREAGIFLPALCMHPCVPQKHLCKICVVEIEGMDGLHEACLPVLKNMAIHTNTRRISEIRRRLLKEIILENQRDCLCCKYSLHCELQQVVGTIGICVE